MAILGQGQSDWDDSLISTLNFHNPPRRDTALLVGNAEKNPNRGGRLFLICICQVSRAMLNIVLGYLVIGFKTNNPGVWMLHCHIIWHSESGMGLQFIERPDEIPAKLYTSKRSYLQECAAEIEYEQADPNHIKSDSTSGV